MFGQNYSELFALFLLSSVAVASYATTDKCYRTRNVSKIVSKVAYYGSIRFLHGCKHIRGCKQYRTAYQVELKSETVCDCCLGYSGNCKDGCVSQCNGRCVNGWCINDSCACSKFYSGENCDNYSFPANVAHQRHQLVHYGNEMYLSCDETADETLFIDAAYYGSTVCDDVSPETTLATVKQFCHYSPFCWLEANDALFASKCIGYSAVDLHVFYSCIATTATKLAWRVAAHQDDQISLFCPSNTMIYVRQALYRAPPFCLDDRPSRTLHDIQLACANKSTCIVQESELFHYRTTICSTARKNFDAVYNCWPVGLTEPTATARPSADFKSKETTRQRRPTPGSTITATTTTTTMMATTATTATELETTPTGGWSAVGKTATVTSLVVLGATTLFFTGIIVIRTRSLRRQVVAEDRQALRDDYDPSPIGDFTQTYECNLGANNAYRLYEDFGYANEPFES